eukprot:3090817-Pyramimonas_sp.AAC.1
MARKSFSPRTCRTSVIDLTSWGRALQPTAFSPRQSSGTAAWLRDVACAAAATSRDARGSK